MAKNKEINWPYKVFSPLLRLIFKLKYKPIIINKEVIPKKEQISLAEIDDRLMTIDDFLK